MTQSTILLEWFKTEQEAKAFVTLMQTTYADTLLPDDKITYIRIKDEWRVYVTTSHMMLTPGGMKL